MRGSGGEERRGDRHADLLPSSHIARNGRRARGRGLSVDPEAGGKKLAVTHRRGMVVYVHGVARGLSVSDAARERILAEEDTRRLDRWLEKAIVAASVDEVLGEGG